MAVLAIWVQASWIVLFCSDDLGWRGVVSGAVPILGVVGGVALGIRGLRTRMKRRAEKKAGAII